MPSELETAMESLIKVFHRYASKEKNTTNTEPAGAQRVDGKRAVQLP